MKILFLSHNFHPFIGGIEVISELLADAFAAAGHEVHLLTWTTDTEEKPFKYKVSRNPDFLKLIRAHAWADLVFENNPCLRLSWPGIFFGRKSVVALHTWIARITGERGIQDRLKLLWLKRAAKVIAVSNALRDKSWLSAVVVGNPYRAADFRIMPDVDRNKSFVFLGRLVSDKGIDLALIALYELKKRAQAEDMQTADLTLTIIGDGPELENLRTLVADLDLETEVQFRGSMSGEALVRELNEYRFLLVPSKWEEPFGVVVLEGMACGCTPIVSDGGGLPDAVGKAGLMFRKGDVDDLADKMSLIRENPVLRNQLREHAADHLKKFHPDKISGQYLSEITGTLN